MSSIKIQRDVAKLNAKKRLHEHLGNSAGAYMLNIGLGAIPVVGLLLRPASEVGVAIHSISTSKLEKPPALKIFEGYNSFIRALWMTFLMLMFLMMWTLTGGVVIGIGLIIILFNTNIAIGVILVIAGTLWSMFICVYKSISYSFCTYVLASEPNLTAYECIQKSKALTADHIGELFILSFTFIGWFLLVMLFFPSVMYVMPYFYITYAYIFAELNGEKIDVNLISVQPVSNSGTKSNHFIRGISGMYTGKTIEVMPYEEYSIGRDADYANIVITENSGKISRRHCTIVYDQENNIYKVTDYSKNGTYLSNGTRIAANIQTNLPCETSIYLGDKINAFKLI